MGCGASMQYQITETEQLRVETDQGVMMYRGPRLVKLSKWETYLQPPEVQSLHRLEPDQYAIIYDTYKTTRRTEAGPQSFFLHPGEELVSINKGISLSETEYCYVKERAGTERLVKGPQCFFPGPYETVTPLQKAIILERNMYVKVQHSLKNEMRVEHGPKIFCPEPSEQVVSAPQHAVEINADTAVLVRNSVQGSERLVQEHGRFFPCAEDEIISVFTSEHMLKLGADDYAVILDTQSNELRNEIGEQRRFLQVHEKLEGIVRQVITLSQNEYCHVVDVAGTHRLVKGPSRLIPGPYETATEKKEAILLDSMMYVRIKHALTGNVMRVERGPQSVFLEPCELLSEGPSKAELIDAETAMLIRDSLSGTLQLIQEPHGLFFPRPQDDIVKVQKLIRLADHDAVALKESLEFSLLTHDSVEIVLEGTLCLQLVNEPKMLSFSCDVTREIHDSAQSSLTQKVSQVNYFAGMIDRQTIYDSEADAQAACDKEPECRGYYQLASGTYCLLLPGSDPYGAANPSNAISVKFKPQVTLKQFAEDFRRIIHEFVDESMAFYEMRGLKLYSFEVVGYHSRDKSVAATATVRCGDQTPQKTYRAPQMVNENVGCHSTDKSVVATADVRCGDQTLPRTNRAPHMVDEHMLRNRARYVLEASPRWQQVNDEDRLSTCSEIVDGITDTSLADQSTTFCQGTIESKQESNSARSRNLSEMREEKYLVRGGRRSKITVQKSCSASSGSIYRKKLMQVHADPLLWAKAPLTFKML